MEDIYIYKRIPPPNSSDPTDSVQVYERYSAINKVFLETVPLILLGFGVPGNYLSILVLSKRSMRDNLFSAYLISMCVFNIVTLTIAMSRHLSVGIIGVEMMAYNPTSCRIVRWLTFTLMSVTSWHLVIITGCRVLYLMNSRTRQYAGCVHPYLVITACFFLCGLLELLITIKGVYFTNKRGSVVECYLHTDSAWIYVQFCTYAVGPAVFLIIFNGILIFLHHGEGSGLQTTMLTKQVRQQLVFLVSVSSVQFIITVFPVAFFYGLLNKMFDLSTRAGEVKGQLAYNATVMLFYCNNATNFLVYCFFWTKFRQEFFNMVTGETSVNPSSETDIRVDPSYRDSKMNQAINYTGVNEDLFENYHNEARQWSYSLAFSNSKSFNDAASKQSGQIIHVEQNQAESSRKGSVAMTLHNGSAAQVRKDSSAPARVHNDSKDSGATTTIQKERKDSSNATIPKERRDSVRISVAETLRLAPRGHSNTTLSSLNKTKGLSPSPSSKEIPRSSLHAYLPDKLFWTKESGTKREAR